MATPIKKRQPTVPAALQTFMEQPLAGTIATPESAPVLDTQMRDTSALIRGRTEALQPIEAQDVAPSTAATMPQIPNAALWNAIGQFGSAIGGPGSVAEAISQSGTDLLRGINTQRVGDLLREGRTIGRDDIAGLDPSTLMSLQGQVALEEQARSNQLNTLVSQQMMAEQLGLDRLRFDLDRQLAESGMQSSQISNLINLSNMLFGQEASLQQSRRPIILPDGSIAIDPTTGQPIYENVPTPRAESTAGQYKFNQAVDDSRSFLAYDLTKGQSPKSNEQVATHIYETSAKLLEDQGMITPDAQGNLSSQDLAILNAYANTYSSLLTGQPFADIQALAEDPETSGNFFSLPYTKTEADEEAGRG